MRDRLFREEVLVARKNDWLGSIRLQPPRVGWYLFTVSLVAVAAIILLLLCGQYTRHEQVEGTLVPRGGVLTLTSSMPGTVLRTLVHEGERVHAGQSLVELSGEQESSTFGETRAAITSQLQSQVNWLKEDIQDQARLTAQKRVDMRSSMSLLNKQLEQLDEQIELQRKRANSALSLYRQWERAGQSGVVSRLQLLQQHDVVLQGQIEIKNLTNKELDLRRQIAQLSGQLSQLPIDTASKRHETERKLSDVAQTLFDNEAKRASVIHAPEDGLAANVLVHPGQTVQAGQPLVSVLPTNSNLIAELWASPKSIGFMSPGQSVFLRYSAFPYQQFGKYIGHISEISRSAIAPDEVSRLLGTEVKEPRYRVRVIPDSQEVTGYGQVEPLRPGMTVEGDVLLGRRKLIDWIIEPLNHDGPDLKGVVSNSGDSH